MIKYITKQYGSAESLVIFIDDTANDQQSIDCRRDGKITSFSKLDWPPHVTYVLCNSDFFHKKTSELHRKGIKFCLHKEDSDACLGNRCLGFDYMLDVLMSLTE